MRIRSSFSIYALLLFLFFVAILPDFSEAVTTPSASELKKAAYKEGELIVKFKAPAPGTTAKSRAVKRDALHARLGAKKVQEFKRLNMQVVKLGGGQTTKEAILNYQADAEVAYAEPNYIVHGSTLPDDPLFDQLWGMNKIEAPAAWDTTTGSANVVVAIIDSGIDYTHPDLTTNLWTNTAELGGVAGVDDDSNGVIDDIYGYNAIFNSGDPLDDQSHGTHVAGTIGGIGNNGEGVTGLNWQTRILACKFLDANNSGSLSDAIACLDYIKGLRDRGEKIVVANNSWGGGYYSQALYDAITTVPDLLFVASAGNNANNIDVMPSYPAAYNLPNIIAVAATDSEDQLAEYSNYSARSVDVAAPGSYIISSIPVSLAEGSPPYSPKNGTSMSSPHVSGLAALLKSQDETRDWRAIKNLILSSGDPLPTLSGKTLSGRRINAYQAVTCSDRQLFAFSEPPYATPEPGTPQTLAVTSIDCALPVGPISLSISGDQTLELLDDGQAPDLAAGDGIFSVTWTPPDVSTRLLTVTGPLGTLQVESPNIGISPPVAAPPALLDTTGHSLFLPLGESLSLTFSPLNGIAPFTWSISSGNLPPEIQIDPQSGELFGTPLAAGRYEFVVTVRDQHDFSQDETWLLIVSPNNRNGWPKELVPRTEGTTIAAETYPPTLADLNGDGKQEVIVSDLHTLFVFDQKGLVASTELAGTLTAPAVADLDADGEPEIVVTLADGGDGESLPIYVFNADLTPKSTFITPKYLTNRYQSRSPVLADFNSDGLIEIVVPMLGTDFSVIDYNHVELFVVTPNGGILPGWPKILPVDKGKSFDRVPALADIDQDNQIELVYPDDSGTVHIFRYDGSMIQWVYNFNQSEPTEVQTPRLIDLNNDGLSEIVIAFDGGGWTYPRFFSPSGTDLAYYPLWENGTTSFASVATNAFAFADFDGDNLHEFVFPSYIGDGNDYLNIVRQDGTPLPGWPIILPSGYVAAPENNQALLADLNGDGLSEIVLNLARFTDTSHGRVYSDHIVAAYGVDGQMLAGFPKELLRSSLLHTTTAIGDLDGDQRAELFAKSEDGRLYSWSMPDLSPALAQSPWPQFAHDSRHSSAIPPLVSMDLFTINPVTSPTLMNSQIISGTRAIDSYISLAPVEPLGMQNVVSCSYPDETTWSCELIDLAEGRNNIWVVGDGRQRLVTIFVDTTPPEITIVEPASDTTYIVPPFLDFLVSDGNFSVSLDGLLINKLPGEGLYPLADGTHLLRIEAVDRIGNGSFTEVVFTIDSSLYDGTSPIKIAPSGNYQENAAINSLGEILWEEGGPGVVGHPLYSSHRGILTTVERYYMNLAMNNLGDFVWSEAVNGQNQILAHIGGVTSQITDGTSSCYSPSINDHGEIVWADFDADGNTKIMSNKRGQLTSGNYSYTDSAINNAGDVVWYQQDEVSEGVGGVVAGQPIFIAATGVSGVRISDSGEIVWSGYDAVRSSSRIYSNLRGQLTFDDSDPTAMHIRPAVNACGDLVFTSMGEKVAIYRLGNNSPCGSETEPNDNQPQAIPLSHDDVVVGTLDGSDPQDWYAIGLAAGAKLTVRINANAVPPDSLTVELADSLGAVVVSATGAQIPGALVYTPPQDGIYTLRLVSTGGKKLGYAVRITLDSAPLFFMVDSVIGSGNGSLNCDTPVSSGNSSHCIATPATGYHLVIISGCGLGTQIGDEYTTEAITGDCTVSADFVINTYTLTVGKAGTGNGLVTSEDLSGITCGAICSDTYNHGDLITLTSVADPGSIFSGWSGACSGTGTCQVTMDDIKNVTATFVALPFCGSIPNIFTPLSNTSGHYQVRWGKSSTAGVTYKLYENGSEIYSGVNTYANLTGKNSGTYAYTVKATKDGYAPSALKGPVNTIVSRTCGNIPWINPPLSNTSGHYLVRWGKSTTLGVTYKLYENGSEIYSGTNTYVNLTGKGNGTYAYTVKATKDGYAPSAFRGPVNTSVQLTCGNIPGLYGPASSSTGRYQIRWNKSSTVGVTYKLYENGSEIYSGPNTYVNLTGKRGGTYLYTVKAAKDGYVASAINGPVTVTVAP